MPGIEIFTISGFGASSGYDPTTGEPMNTAATPATSSAPPAAQLQNALKALGTTVGDPALTSIKVDGIIGPATVKAMNYALSKYIGATKYFPAANLDVTKVRQYAAGLAGMVTDRVHKSGGTVPAAVVVHAVKRVASRSSGIYVPPMPAAASSFFEDNRTAIFWGVGGVSALVILSALASALKSRPIARRAAA